METFENEMRTGSSEDTSNGAPGKPRKHLRSGLSNARLPEVAGRQAEFLERLQLLVPPSRQD